MTAKKLRGLTCGTTIDAQGNTMITNVNNTRERNMVADIRKYFE